MSEFLNCNKIMMEISESGHQQSQDSIRAVIPTFPFYFISQKTRNNIKVSGAAPVIDLPHGASRLNELSLTSPTYASVLGRQA